MKFFVVTGIFSPIILRGGEYSRKNLHKEILRWVNGLNNNHLKNKDRGTMAFGLELRLPFIDHLGFFEYGLSIDPFLKVKNNQEKYILRRVIRESELPDSMINRKKAYFHMESGVPFILNEYFGIRGKGSLQKRFGIYKEIFERIFIKKENYLDIDMNQYNMTG
ncbi:hypothetical protein GF323_04460 [Candidatus Woesearchaeota archaeon]|nr:hypothetical protein [Candidatus Woesearchaeota archaeon]